MDKVSKTPKASRVYDYDFSFFVICLLLSLVEYFSTIIQFLMQSVLIQFIPLQTVALSLLFVIN